MDKSGGFGIVIHSVAVWRVIPKLCTPFSTGKEALSTPYPQGEGTWKEVTELDIAQSPTKKVWKRFFTLHRRNVTYWGDLSTRIHTQKRSC